MNALLSFADDRLLFVLWDATLKGTLLLILGGVAALAAGRASAATRQLIVGASLIGALLLPAMSLLLPEWRVPWIPQWMAAESLVAVEIPWRETLISSPTIGQVQPTIVESPVGELPFAQSTASVPREKDANVADARPIAFHTPSAPKLNLAQIVVAVWFAGVIIALSPLAIGMFLVIRLTRGSVTCTSPVWQSQAASTGDQLGLRRPVNLRMHDRVRSPLTWGAIQPVLLLPTAAEKWPADRRQVVLFHELAHVKRFDWLTQTLAYLACAVYWFNPLAWWAVRRMRVEREAACDDDVLAAGSRPADYADELLKLASAIMQRRLVDWAAVPMARRSTLEGRLLAILDGTRNRAALTRSVLAASLITFVAIVVPVAMLRAAQQDSNQKSATAGENTKTSTERMASPHIELLAVEKSQGTTSEFWAPDGGELPADALAVLRRVSQSARPTPIQDGALYVLNVLVRNVPPLDPADGRKWHFEIVGQPFEPELVSFDRVSELNGQLIRFVAANIPPEQITLIARCGFAQANDGPLVEFQNVRLLPNASATTQPLAITASRLAQLAAPYKAIHTSPNSLRKFVRIVVGPGALTFEGQATTWELLPSLLTRVVDRAHTVLELAISSDTITVGQLNDLQSRNVLLAKLHGFEYASYIGVHPLGSSGTTQAAEGDWGEPVNGISARLRAEFHSWAFGQPIELKLDIRNQSNRSTIPETGPQACGLIIDGTPYRWLLPMGPHSSSGLSAGDVRTGFGIPVRPDLWVRLEDDAPLQPLPVGKHTLQVLVPASKDENTNSLTNAASNVFEIEVINTTPEPARAATDIRELRGRIEKLIQGAPVSIKYAEIGIFEAVPGTRGEYRIRADVAQREVLPDGGPLSFVPLGVVYQQKDQNRFYIQWDGLGASTRHFYGPFPGDPADVLRFPVSEPAGTESGKSADLKWGPAVGDLQMAARIAKPEWTTNETPLLLVSLKNDGKPLEYLGMFAAECRIQVDGKWFGYAKLLEIGAKVRELRSGAVAYDVISIPLDGEAWAEINDLHDWPLVGGQARGNQLALPPGKHTVTVMFQSASRRTPPDETAVVQSAPIELTIGAENPGNAESTPAWGESVEGISARLSLATIIDRLSPNPQLDVSVRNQSQTAWRAENIGELEVDGVWYQWSSHNTARVIALPPGRTFGPIRVFMETPWISKEEQRPLALTPGKHMVRFAIMATPEPVAGEAQRQHIRVVSNPLEVVVANSQTTDPLESARQLRIRIEQLVKGKEPARNLEELEIFVRVEHPTLPNMASLNLRQDIPQRRFTRDVAVGFNGGSPGAVHYLPDKKRFYVHWAPALSAAERGGRGYQSFVGGMNSYYGPFEGDPAVVLGFAVPRAESDPPDTTYEERAQANSQWGEAVIGVSALLRADIGTPTDEMFWAKSIFAQSRRPGLPAWTTADVPEVWLWVRNLGERDWDMPAPQVVGELEFDGKWYAIKELAVQVGVSQLTRKERERGHIEIRLNGNWRAKESDEKLALTPGRHTVRFAFAVHARDGQEPKEARIVTNAVELPIVAAEPRKE